MIQPLTGRQTLDDLFRHEGKAELIGGRIVDQMPAGHAHSQISFRIAISLNDHRKRIRRGVAYPDNIGYAGSELPSGRESFSPDASYYDGPLPVNLAWFIDGAPNFGAEIRSPDDYGPAAERAIAAKREDYFLAGTIVVWDVDPRAEEIRKHHRDAPNSPTVFRRGDIADAEPAVPGWRMTVAAIFDED
jgi:Uma2 family endonuclease